MSLLMTPSSLSVPTASDTRLEPTTMPVTDLDPSLTKIQLTAMPAYDDLDQLLDYGSAAGGDLVHEPIEEFWSTSLFLADLGYLDSFDLYSLRTKIEFPIDTAAAIL
jgi:hypothetical protein